MYKKHLTSAPDLEETRQSYWQLAAIQLSGWTSLPILATSILVLQTNTLFGAVCTIVIGNGILWFIRLGIILMSQKRQSTLDITKNYLGHFGSYFIAALLLISTLVWFIAQTTEASNTLTHLILLKENANINQFSQVSVFLGIVSAFLCMEGIVLLRRLAMFSFPILFVGFFLIILSLPFRLPEGGSTVFSLSGLTLVLGTNLGLTSDLPTFFRHSRSLLESIKALTVIQLFSLFLALCSLYLATFNFAVDETFTLSSGNNLLRVSLIIFVFLSVICANVANVYSASVGWEVLAPKALVGRKEYLILGLGLTTIFILVSDIFSMKVFLDVSDNSLVNLCIVLVLAYLIRKKNRKMPDLFNQFTYFSAWLFSTVANILQNLGLMWKNPSTLLVSIVTILMTILVGSVLKKIVLTYMKCYSDLK